MLNRRCTVTYIHAKFLSRLGQWPFHWVPLQDHLLVGVDRILSSLCIIRVVPRLVPARLIGRLRFQRLFTLAPEVRA